MKAKIARVQLDIDYLCPNCYLHFRLTNSEIPRNKYISQSCPACKEPLKISPISLEINACRSSVITDSETITPDSDDSLRAIKALQAQGYSKKEAQARVRAIHKNDMRVSELIREAISYEQPA